MSSRIKLGIWLLVGYAGSWAFVWILSVLNINPRDPTLGDDAYTAAYAVEGVFAQSPVAGEGQPLVIDTSTQTDGARLLRYSGARGQVAAPIRPDGTVEDGVYPLIWVHLLNPITHFGSKAWTAVVRDDAGLIGEPGRAYEVRDLGTFILWDYALSSQASHRAAIYDGDKRVASAIYDATCGLLFDLVTHRGGYSHLRLRETSFPISRNRYKIVIWSVLFAVAIITVYRTKLARAPVERRAVALDRFHLSVAIATTVLVDYLYDTWLFDKLGDWFTVVLHLAVFALWFWYFRLWALGLLLELLLPVAFIVSASKTLVPVITYCPSMLITVFLMLMLRPTPKGRKT